MPHVQRSDPVSDDNADNADDDDNNNIPLLHSDSVEGATVEVYWPLCACVTVRFRLFSFLSLMCLSRSVRYVCFLYLNVCCIIWLSLLFFSTFLLPVKCFVLCVCFSVFVAFYASAIINTVHYVFMSLVSVRLSEMLFPPHLCHALTIFTELLLLVHYGTEMKWLGFVVKGETHNETRYARRTIHLFVSCHVERRLKLRLSFSMHGLQIKRRSFLSFFHNSVKWWQIYTKFLAAVAERIPVPNISTKFGC